MKSRVLASIWAYRAQALFGQRQYEKAYNAFTAAYRRYPDVSPPAIWQGYCALTLFYMEKYSEALPQMECALFALRGLKNSSREAYWLNHEILARLKEANMGTMGQVNAVLEVKTDMESQG